MAMNSNSYVPPGFQLKQQTEIQAREYCSEFGVDIEQVLLEYEQFQPKEKSEQVIGNGNQFGLDGKESGTEESTVAPRTCTQCKGIPTGTLNTVAHVTQGASATIIAGGASSSTYAKASGAAAARGSCVWPIVFFLLLGLIV